MGILGERWSKSSSLLTIFYPHFFVFSLKKYLGQKNQNRFRNWHSGGSEAKTELAILSKVRRTRDVWWDFGLAGVPSGIRTTSIMKLS